MTFPKIKRSWIAALAALWLVGQLASAFHLGHDDSDSLAAAEHSCVLCKVALADDVLVASPLLLALSFLFLLPAFAVTQLAARQAQRHAQARAPPAI